METPEMVKDKEMSKLDSIMMSETDVEPTEPTVVATEEVEPTEPVDAWTSEPVDAAPVVEAEPDEPVEPETVEDINEDLVEKDEEIKGQQQDIEEFVDEATKAVDAGNMELAKSMFNDAANTIKWLVTTVDEKDRLLSAKEAELANERRTNQSLSKAYEDTATEKATIEVDLLEKSKLYDQVMSDPSMKSLLTLRSASKKNPDKYTNQYAETLKTLVLDDLWIDINELAIAKKESMKTGFGEPMSQGIIPAWEAKKSSALEDISVD